MNAFDQNIRKGANMSKQTQQSVVVVDQELSDQAR